MLKKILFLSTLILAMTVSVFASYTVSDNIYSNDKHKGSLTVRFLGLNELGVNNSEATLIIFPNGTNMLIDMSYAKKYDAIADMLKKSGVSKIDTLLITHYHSDHTGNFSKLASNFKIGKVYLPEFPTYRGKEYNEILDTIKTQKLTYQFVNEADVIQPDKDVEIEFLNPPGVTAYPEGMTDDKEKSKLENNNSVVFTLKHNDIKMLFASDIYTATETRLIKTYGDKLKSDLLKIPHHGISTSSSAPFLAEVSPEYSVIMSGQPSIDTFDSISYRSKAFVTAAYGTILAVSDGKKITIHTEHDDKTNGLFKTKDLMSLRFFATENDGERNGDCTLIVTPDNKTILVDTGVASVSKKITEMLEALGIKTLDYVILSHFHSDHIGGYAYIAKHFKVNEVLTVKLDGYTDKIYAEMMDLIKKQGTKLTYVHEGQGFTFSDEVKMTILNPPAETRLPDGFSADSDTDFINNNSVVFRMVYKDTSFLFAGDVFSVREYELANKYGDKLQSNLLKIPHHGSSTSSTMKFLLSISPFISVISSARPSIQTYETIVARSEKTFMTGIDGTIHVTSDGSQLTVSTENKRKLTSLYGDAP